MARLRKQRRDLCIRDVPLCVLDIETTGLYSDTDRIVEIWIGRYQRNEKKDEFHTLVNPGCKIPLEARQIHRITNKMVSHAPKFRDFASDLVRFVGNDTIVTHTGFDMKFINSELMRAGLRPLSNHSIDTCALARRQFLFRKNYNQKRDRYETNTLQNIVRELGLNEKPGHRAKSDGKATASVLFKMIGIFEREWALSVADVDDLQRSVRTPSAKKVEKSAKISRKHGRWQTH